jgi:hypothetical protein
MAAFSNPLKVVDLISRFPYLVGADDCPILSTAT